MISNKDFFTQLQEGEEYANFFMTMDAYNGLELEVREKMTDPVIRQHSTKFKDDEIHCKLVRERSKINDKIIEREFILNHGNTK